MIVFTYIFSFLKVFQQRNNLIPFEGGFALLILYNSIVGLLRFGIVPNSISASFGNTVTLISNIIFLAAGLSIYFGVGLARRDIEAFGLILVIACLITRILLIASALGAAPLAINNYMFNSIFIVTCIIRLNTIFRKHVIIRLDELPQIEFGSYGKLNTLVNR